MKFAVMFGNRGFFPGELIASARRDFASVLKKNGHESLMMDESLSRYGAVETPEEGRRFAAFLAERKNEVDGVVVALANFGDENGALYALRDAGMPILVQAYPDEIGKMDFSHRRDAVCGKIAMCNVLRQAGVKFTLTRDFAVDPKSKAFAEDLRIFAAVCRVVKGMRRLNVAAVGARTTAFKTVRFDEIAYQKKGVGIETIDLSHLFSLMEKADAKEVAESVNALKRYADFGNWPDAKAEALSRLAIALGNIKDDLSIDAFAIRCWDEFQHRWGIAPCGVRDGRQQRRRDEGALTRRRRPGGALRRQQQLREGEGQNDLLPLFGASGGDAKRQGPNRRAPHVPQGVWSGDGCRHLRRQRQADVADRREHENRGRQSVGVRHNRESHDG